MKKLIMLAALLGLSITSAHAFQVNQIVFSRISTVTPAKSNLRVTPMDGDISRDSNRNVLQTFAWAPGKTQNLYLTKTTTFPLSNAFCVWVQVDQDTNVTVNSETNYMTLSSGYNGELCFK